MPNSTQFAVAIHTAGMLALDETQCVTSETIAKSVSTNPAVVRRIIAQLVKNGLVTVRKGKGGGAALARPAGEISLAQVYYAVEPTPLLPIPRMAGSIKLGADGAECSVSHAVSPVLTEFFAHAEAGLLHRLEEFSLADFIAAVQHRMSEQRPKAAVAAAKAATAAGGARKARA